MFFRGDDAFAQPVPIAVGTYRDKATGASDGRVPYGHDLLGSTTEVSTLIHYSHNASSVQPQIHAVTHSTVIHDKMQLLLNLIGKTWLHNWHANKRTAKALISLRIRTAR